MPIWQLIIVIWEFLVIVSDRLVTDFFLLPSLFKKKKVQKKA